jgi:hypothetical protein
MNGRPQDDDANNSPLEQELGELLGPEPLEPRPQRRVGIQRHLSLKPDQVLDGVLRRQIRATEQELALQGGAIQGPPAEHVAHRPILTGLGKGRAGVDRWEIVV